MTDATVPAYVAYCVPNPLVSVGNTQIRLPIEALQWHAWRSMSSRMNFLFGTALAVAKISDLRSSDEAEPHLFLGSSNQRRIPEQ